MTNFKSLCCSKSGHIGFQHAERRMFAFPSATLGQQPEQFLWHGWTLKLLSLPNKQGGTTSCLRRLQSIHTNSTIVWILESLRSVWLYDFKNLSGWWTCKWIKNFRCGTMTRKSSTDIRPWDFWTLQPLNAGFQSPKTTDGRHLSKSSQSCIDGSNMLKPWTMLTSRIG